MIARLYDALHEDHKSGKNVLTMPTESGGFTHRYFKAPTSLEEQVAGRDAIAEWARVTYGWLGRSSDLKPHSWERLAPMPSFMRHSRRTRGAGIA
jgi:4-hydroxyphenylacetate 3-monooxygenase